MLNDLLEFLTSGGEARREKASGQNEMRVAAAALLVHAAFIDGRYDEREEARLRQLLAQRFALEPTALERLLRTAECEERDAVDLYKFTRVLTEQLDQHGRQDIVAMLWEIVLADGKVHSYEENLVARVSELLGVSARDRVRLRKEIETGQSPTHPVRGR